MNILYINHYAGAPELGMEFRPFYLSREWKKMGYNTLIVASSESHVRSKKIEFYGGYKEQMIDGVSYLWCKTLPYKGNGIGRVLNIFSFLFRLILKVNYFYSYRPKVIIASSTYPLDIFPAWIISKLTGARLIFEVHDLWPLSPIELGGVSKFHPFMLLLQFAESFAYRFSDIIVSMLPCAKDHMMDHGMADHKFLYIPNGIDLKEWTGVQEKVCPHDLLLLLQQDKEKDFFSIAYLGAHGVANNLENFLEAAKTLKASNISFYLIGSGPEKESLKAKASLEELNNVHFLDAVPKYTVPAITPLFDCLYIGLQNQPLFRFGISPNKMMDYMAGGRPIISAIKAGNDMVSEAGCGYSISPSDSLSLAECILRMTNLSEAERNRMGVNGRKFVTTNHDYSILAKKFADIFGG